MREAPSRHLHGARMPTPGPGGLALDRCVGVRCTDRGPIPVALAGWVTGIAGVTTVVLLLTGTDPAGSGPSSVAAWIELGLGTLLLLLAARQWFSRPDPGEQPEAPSWMAAIDRFTAVRAAGLGLVLSALNPKAVLVCVAAGAVIAHTSSR